MTLRGKAAIVGIGEVPTRRSYPGRTTYGLCAEAARAAIQDAGLRKEDITGLVTDGTSPPAGMAEYIGIRPTFATGVNMQGASGATATAVAAAAVNAGLCDTVLVVMGGRQGPRGPRGPRLQAYGPSGRSLSAWRPAKTPATASCTGGTCTSTAPRRSSWPRWPRTRDITRSRMITPCLTASQSQSTMF